MGEKLDLETLPDDINLLALVGGLILLVLLSVGMSWIFVYLNKQLNITHLYDNFISNITHELKSPLSSFQLYVETLRKRDVSRQKQLEFLKMMQQDTDRLDNLINSILYLSALENKKLIKTVHRDYNIFNSNTLILNIVSELQKEFKLDKKTIMFKGRADCECVVDRSWLKIVISNLIDNALKYSVEKPKILIRINKDSKYFYIDVIDNGIGIKNKDLKKIFNKFQRINNSESPNVKGTGLGLFWVKEIVKRHGGKIKITSAGINKGSNFQIALPIYKTSKRRYIKRLLKRTGKRTESKIEA